MNLENFYSSLTKIKYKDYTIDDQFNLKLLKELDIVTTLFIENNIEYYITGAFSLIFYTGKIYRTIKDVDILVNLKDIKQLFSILDENYSYYPYPKTNTLANFFKSKILKEDPFRFKNKNDLSIKLEIFFDKKPIFSGRNKVFSKKINNNELKYLIPNKFFDESYPSSRYSRQKDIDDIVFYSRFLNI
jgi:hypothetical protein